FVFVHDGVEVTREATSALDRFLSDARYLGDIKFLETLARPEEEGSPDGLRHGARDRVAQPFRPARHSVALLATVDVARELAPLAPPRPASQQLALLLAFWSAHLRPIPDADRFSARERRARAAIADTITSLAASHAALDDPEWTIDDVAIAVRRWIEQQTFMPDRSRERTLERSAAAGPEAPGVCLVDDHAAPYGDFDDIAIVGLVDAEWPERPRRNIFYPPSILKSLGWPSEKDRRAAADARFLDLLESSSRRTSVSTVTLDDDALVPRSMQRDEIPGARLSSVARAPFDGARVFADEALSLDPISLEPFAGEPRAWAELRAARSPADASEYHGSAGAAPARAWSVSAIETYLDCPFKFFAQHVLQLDEEPDDEEVMDPRRQGQFVHGVFETFFRECQNPGHRAITPRNLDAARELFA